MFGVPMVIKRKRNLKVAVIIIHKCGGNSVRMGTVFRKHS
jgi:hypothetical protein